MQPESTSKKVFGHEVMKSLVIGAISEVIAIFVLKTIDMNVLIL